MISSLDIIGLRVFLELSVVLFTTAISSSYEGFRTSCNYLRGFIYLLNNFTEILFYFLAKFKIFNSKIFFSSQLSYK